MSQLELYNQTTFSGLHSHVTSVVKVRGYFWTGPKAMNGSSLKG